MRSMILALFLTATTFSSTTMANTVINVPTQPQQSIMTPAPPALEEPGYILMDANSGKIIAEKNADQRLAPASVTKLMTMYVVSNALKMGSIHLDDKVRISKKAWQTSGSRMFVKVNDDVPVKDLLQGIVVASGNDAAVAMAEYMAGSEESFADMMNTQAKLIGMNNSHFVDSNGLPNPDHYSTARDLALLAQAIIKHFPEDYKMYSEKWFTYNNIRQPNRNRLLWRYPYADGLKTGHTDDAGYCLVSSALKDGTRLISVIMGAKSDEVRTEDSIKLLTYGFRFFETHKVADASKTRAIVRVWKGQQKTVELGLPEDLYVTIPAGQAKNIQVQLIANELKAPVIKGQPYGTIQVVLNKEVIFSKPLVALQDDLKGGLFRRMTDSMSYGFHKLFSRSNEKANNG